jgi:hypothetical protein
MDQDELEFEPMHRGRLRPLLLAAGVVLVGAGVAYAVNSRFSGARRRAQLARTATAWNQLRRCLVGEALRPGERPSALVRRTELGLPRAVYTLPPAERVRQWPFRCASPASVMTHALFESGSDDPQHRMLAMLASRAASALERGQLHTGTQDRLGYIDELFEVARRAHLPPGEPAAGPLPPPPVQPLSPRAMTALFADAGRATVVASDPVAGRALRVVVGATTRRLCQFPFASEPARQLASVRCTEVRFADAPARVEILGADDAAPAVLRVRRGDGPEGDLYLAAAPTTPLHQGNLGGYVDASGAVATLQRAPSPGASWSLVRLAPPAAPAVTPLALPFEPAATVTPLVLEREVLVVSAARVEGAGDAAVSTGGTQRLATVPFPGAPGAAARELGVVPAPAGTMPVVACRAGTMLSVAVFGGDDHAAVVFRTDAGWSPPRSVSARAGAFTCREREATLTWTETTPARLVRQVRCTPEGCRSEQGPLPDFGAEPAATDLAGRVLLAVSPGPGRGLRLRLAPVAQLEEADDLVVFDDADHGGLQLEPVGRPLVRGDAAVVLVTAASETHPTYAVRVDASGAFAPVRHLDGPAR